MINLSDNALSRMGLTRESAHQIELSAERAELRRIEANVAEWDDVRTSSATEPTTTGIVYTKPHIDRLSALAATMGY